MTSSLSNRMKDPECLLSACKVALPSWSEATLSDFSSTAIKECYSSSNPLVYLATCSLPDVKPTRVVIKMESENQESLFYPFSKELANSDGPYQGRVARQLGAAGLGPHILYLESEEMLPNWGLMVMEELQKGEFEHDFDIKNVSTDFMKKLGSLFGSLHLQPTVAVVVESHVHLMKKLLLKNNVLDDKKFEELYNTMGGYTPFLVYLWQIAFPDWLKANSPTNYPLSKPYSDRFLAAILDTASIKPLNQVMGKLGFSHFDLCHDNLMKRGEKVLAIDCETSSIGPAFLDFGGILYSEEVFNGRKKYLNRSMRKALALSFFDTVGEECENMDEALYDLELAAIHRHLWSLLFRQFGLLRKYLTKLEEIGGFMIEKAEIMAETMKKAREDEKLMEEVLENGVYWASRKLLKRGNEEKIMMITKKMDGEENKDTL